MMTKRLQTIALAALLLDEEERNEDTVLRTQKRSCWVRSWLQRREEKVCYHNLFKELLLEDTESFREFVRMDRNHFQFLVKKLWNHLYKKDTKMRKSITPDEKVSLFLWYLATGESFRSLEFTYRVSRRSISRIAMEKANAIITEMQKTYLKTPSNENEWIEISEKLFQRWSFPNLTAAIDGKHIVLGQPKQSGSHYRNYKGTDRIILIAVVGSEYEFLFADVGMNGCKSDGGNWSRSPMKKALEENSHDLPKATPLPTTLMKPFPQSNLKMEKRVFNYRSSRSRPISENAFGILANLWRVSKRPFDLEPENLKIITLSALILHNWLRSESSSGKATFPNHLLTVKILLMRYCLVTGDLMYPLNLGST